MSRGAAGSRRKLLGPPVPCMATGGPFHFREPLDVGQCKLSRPKAVLAYRSTVPTQTNGAQANACHRLRMEPKPRGAVPYFESHFAVQQRLSSGKGAET